MLVCIATDCVSRQPAISISAIGGPHIVRSVYTATLLQLPVPRGGLESLPQVGVRRSGPAAQCWHWTSSSKVNWRLAWKFSPARLFIVGHCKPVGVSWSKQMIPVQLVFTAFFKNIFRTVLIAGKERLVKRQTIGQRQQEEEKEDLYLRVYNLQHHADKTCDEEMFQYIVTSALLATYLHKYRKLFILYIC